MRHYPPKTPRNPSGAWSPTRDRAEQAAFRRMLINRTGPSCQACGATNIPLQAHHTTPTDGMLLCRPCHKAVDPHAR
jgi:5-methylcytosine-specific restriction endonuclease McrA